MTKKDGEDAPARLYVTFAYESTMENLWENVKFEAVKLFYGEYPPIASLVYVWVSHCEQGTIMKSLYTSRVKIIVLESGAVIRYFVNSASQREWLTRWVLSLTAACQNGQRSADGAATDCCVHKNMPASIIVRRKYFNNEFIMVRNDTRQSVVEHMHPVLHRYSGVRTLH